MDTHNRTLSNESTRTLPINEETTGDATPVFIQTLVKSRLDPANSSKISKPSSKVKNRWSHLVEQAEKLIATLASHKTYNQLPYAIVKSRPSQASPHPRVHASLCTRLWWRRRQALYSRCQFAFVAEKWRPDLGISSRSCGYMAFSSALRGV